MTQQWKPGSIWLSKAHPGIKAVICGKDDLHRVNHILVRITANGETVREQGYSYKHMLKYFICTNTFVVPKC